MDELGLTGPDPSLNHVESSGHYQQTKECNVGPSSIHETYLNKQVADENPKSQPSVPNGINETIFPKSMPEPAVSGEDVRPVLLTRPVDFQARQKCYPPYWPAEAVSKALEVDLNLLCLICLCKLCQLCCHLFLALTARVLIMQEGGLFTAVFRVNAHNSVEVCPINSSAHRSMWNYMCLFRKL